MIIKNNNEIKQFNAHILVVEDNKVNQRVAQGMLEKFGVDVDLAANGEEAMSLLEQGSYDLIFMDCQMPVLNGFETTRKIRDQESKVNNHAIPIIAMTANALQGDRNRCIASGMDDYISKPVRASKVQQMLEQWLPDSHHQFAAQDIEIDEMITQQPSETEPFQVGKIQQGAVTVFDYIAMSERLMGDKELISTVAEVFLSDIPGQIEQLQLLVKTGDVEQIAGLAHKIKGASANVGGMALSESAFKMEQAGKVGDLDTIRQRMFELTQSFVELKTAMEDVFL